MIAMNWQFRSVWDPEMKRSKNNQHIKVIVVQKGTHYGPQFLHYINLY
jgi:hypothetical protein